MSGRWVADLSTQDATETLDVYEVANGLYACLRCTPPRRYPADGKLRPVPGDPGVSESVTVISPRAIVTRIVSQGRTRETTMTVDAQDRTATYVSIDHRDDLPGTLMTEYLARRVAPAPRGANQVSGSWRGVRYVSVPEALRAVDLHDDGRRFTWAQPTGEHFTASYGGPYAPIQSRNGVIGLAAVKRVDARTVVETRKAGGKLVMTRTYRLSQDGKSLSMATLNEVTGSTFRATSRRAGTPD